MVLTVNKAIFLFISQIFLCILASVVYVIMDNNGFLRVNLKMTSWFFLISPFIYRTSFSLLRIFIFLYFADFLHTSSPNSLHGSCDVAHTPSVKCRLKMTVYTNVYKFNSMQGSMTFSRCLFFFSFFLFFFNLSSCTIFLLGKVSLHDYVHQFEFELFACR